ncbi:MULTISPECIES: galactosyldiacylglycerol synthase [unclassified Streptomyces]|nr:MULTISPECIES: galactosyldiacylglycerol synthase [unclassified Streptomyces]AEN13730.1 Monogalactosyldiacylglycerol synthase [Streptomyces sp. SirexAA-E]MYR65638.1 galactosyldiacylglycerol synthase [Streptomyces sp. SID4939]MYS00815.1 galactosyldiacylglycerol synthase [Streptomyces sp. SID4940]MYT67618.1 galactosyldiacylglycerol synthase [Streptomyces sp. SID8357]MYT86462.1 galactosyldiacylglycerol synthase [Streptomyces sp. SID8360]
MNAAQGRFLILSAGMGSGHHAVAAELTRRLEAGGGRTRTVDVLDLLPPGVGRGLSTFYRTVICHAPAVYAGLYAAFFRAGDGPRPGSAPLAALAERRLLELVGRLRPDVVVPVFHLAAQLTGRLRARGALTVPSAVVVTDFAVHRQWLHPGNDTYLCLTPDLAGEVARAVGRPAVASGALVAPRFRGPAGTVRDWRRRLGPPDRPPVLISTGAWGAGAGVAGTARLVASAGYRPVVLCGHNARLRREASRGAPEHAMGWVEDMPGLLSACRALVDNAAGQTALEAMAVGVPVVSFRTIPGHGREGSLRMAEHGFADYAPDAGALIRSLDALTRPGAARERRVEAASGLFSGEGVRPLEALLRTAGRSGTA